MKCKNCGKEIDKGQRGFCFECWCNKKENE